MRKEGISLVALVITIIVIIILTVAVIFGSLVEEGIIEKAKYAVEEHNKVQELEKITHAVQIAKSQNEGIILTEELNKQLNKNFNDDVEAIENNDGWNYKEYKILKNGEIIKKGSILPDEYQQVEYIQSTGTQYIDTKVSNAEGYRAKLKFMLTKKLSKNDNNILIGVNAGSNECFLGMNQLTIRIYNNGKCYNTSKKLDLNTVYNIDVKLYSDYTSLKVDEENILDQTYGGGKRTTASNVCLFASKSYFEYSEGYYKIYLAQIYNQNDKLIRDFIPCYQKSDGKVGLYDLVEGEFYVNGGTGEFLKGENV